MSDPVDARGNGPQILSDASGLAGFGIIGLTALVAWYALGKTLPVLLAAGVAAAVWMIILSKARSARRMRILLSGLVVLIGSLGVTFAYLVGMSAGMAY